MAEFHLFPCLPFELRARIWELTVEPRTVEIRIHRRNWPTTIQTMTSSTPVPAVLHACHESRTQGLYQRAFTLATEGHEPRYVWVNFEVDMISIGDTDTEHVDPAERLLIRRLRFERESDDSFFFFESHSLAKEYPNVEELHVICPDAGGAYAWHDCWEGCPWPCPKENIRFIDKGTGWVATGADLDRLYEEEWGPFDDN
ncbi:hypothetical protein BJX61DRAFT_281103 [Aspergillus egyptiacus]|nr:hypothetical protein BJX61DRAFT_281103 [Aspergillus egyptiacus]